jgi:hypothetical protein
MAEVDDVQGLRPAGVAGAGVTRRGMGVAKVDQGLRLVVPIAQLAAQP